MRFVKNYQKLDVFIKSKIKEIKEDGVLYKEYKKRIPGQVETDGCFDFENMELLLSKKSMWRTTFIHEYCHYLQYKKSKKVYLDLFKKKIDPNIILDNYILGKIKYSNTVKKVFFQTRKLEMDCEKEAVKLIKKEKLPIDIKIYSQLSNRYILFYHLVEKTANWNPNEKFYAKNILNLIPDTIQSSYVHKIPKKLEKLLLPYFEK